MLLYAADLENVIIFKRHTNHFGITFLHSVCSEKDVTPTSLEIAIKLLDCEKENASYLNAQTNTKMTAFMFTCSSNHHTMCRLLLKYKPNLDMQDNQGNTALHHAAMSGEIECAELLLKAGASSKIINKESELPYFLATEKKSLPLLELFTKFKCPRIVNNAKCSYHLALIIKWMEGILFMRNGSIMRNLHLAGGQTDIHIAVCANFLEYIKYIEKEDHEWFIMALKTKNKENKLPIDYLSSRETCDYMLNWYITLQPENTTRDLYNRFYDKCLPETELRMEKTIEENDRRIMIKELQYAVNIPIAWVRKRLSDIEHMLPSVPGPAEDEEKKNK